MEGTIKTVLLITLCLSLFTSVTKGGYQSRHSRSTGNEKKEMPNGIPLLEVMASLASPYLYATPEPVVVESGTAKLRNDEIQWTHEHVDQIIGAVPPTKRIKKILPPFEKGRSERSANTWIGGVHSNSLSEAQPEPGRKPVTRRKEGEPRGQGAISASDQSAKISPSPRKPMTVVEKVSDSLTEQDAPAPEYKLEGSRLVPGEYETPATQLSARVGEAEDEEGKSTMEKSIWDLLKEREQVNAREPDLLDALDSGKNESRTTSPGVRTAMESPFAHFDSDSEEVETEMKEVNMGNPNVEKQPEPLSYALLWLNVKQDSKLTAEWVDGDTKINVTEKWKEDVEEMKRLLLLMEDEKTQERITPLAERKSEDDKSTVGRWYLILLAGNATIIQFRKSDFTKYLKLNLAARLNVEYDDVQVNQVVLATPKILVNVSVLVGKSPRDSQDGRYGVGDKGEMSMHNMAKTNATLLELSGEEYHVVRFFPLEARKPEAEAHTRVSSVSKTSKTGDLEFIMYIFLGSCCASVLVLMFLITMNKYFRKVSDSDWSRVKSHSGAWRTGHHSRETENPASPAVIYSNGLARSRGSWMREMGSPSVNLMLPVPRSPSPEPSSSRWIASPDLDPIPPPSSRPTKLKIYKCDVASLVLPLDVRIRPTEPALDEHTSTN